MAKFKEKVLAIKLRKSGNSVGQIAKKLSVSKSTVSIWCRDIPLDAKQKKLIANRTNQRAVEALLKASEQQRNDRLKRIKQFNTLGRNDVSKLTYRDIFMVGLGLYWGEGYKKGSQELGFTNSDPIMIIFYIKWLDVVYSVNKKDLILRVSINQSHSDRVSDVERYWSKLTSIPQTQFTKTSLIKSKSLKNFPEREKHFGTLRIKVRRGTDLRRRILGSIEALGD